MRFFAIVAVTALLGCSTTPEKTGSGAPTLADLKKQQEKQQEAARQKRGDCPSGHVLYCERRVGRKVCGCVDRARMVQAMRW